MTKANLIGHSSKGSFEQKHTTQHTHTHTLFTLLKRPYRQHIYNIIIHRTYICKIQIYTHTHTDLIYPLQRPYKHNTQREITYIYIILTHISGTAHKYRIDYIQSIHKCTSMHRDPIELTNITYTSRSLTYHIYRLYTHNIHAHAVHNRYKTQANIKTYRHTQYTHTYIYV